MDYPEKEPENGELSAKELKNKYGGKSNNWIPIDKAAACYLPTDREYTKLEALFSYQKDLDEGKDRTISGYAHLWKWSRTKVRKFLSDVEKTDEKQMKDRRKTDGKQPIHVINKDLWDGKKQKKNSKKTVERQMKDTTIYPNPNPNTENIYRVLFDFWNSQAIIRYEIYPPPTSGRTTIETAIKNLLKAKETVETIRQAILNYKKILDSEEHYFSHKWGLVEFLVRGFYKFKDWGIADSNYKRHEFSGNGKPNWANFTPVRGGETPDGRKIIAELQGGYFQLEDKTYLQFKSNRWVNVDGQGKPVSL